MFGGAVWRPSLPVLSTRSFGFVPPAVEQNPRAPPSHFLFKKCFAFFFFLSTVKTITHEPSHATTTQIENSFQLNFFFSSKNWNKKIILKRKSGPKVERSLSPMCVWVALEWFNANPSNTHTHTHLTVVWREREDRRRARTGPWTREFEFAVQFLPQYLSRSLSLALFSLLFDSFLVVCGKGGSTTSDRYIIGIARNQCEWNQQPASQPEQSRFLFLSVLLLLLLLLCVKMLENNFGNRIWLSRACEGWDGAYFNLVETTKCGGVRNGKKEKNKQQEKSWKEKWRKRRRSFIDWHVDRYGDDFYFWTDFTSIHFQFPLFFTASRKRFLGATTTTTTTTTCSFPKNLFRLFLFRPDYDRIEEAFFHIVPQCEHSISLDKQTTLDILANTSPRHSQRIKP